MVAEVGVNGLTRLVPVLEIKISELGDAVFSKFKMEDSGLVKREKSLGFALGEDDF